MDYPTDTSPEKSENPHVDFKRKRDEANPWGKRLGSALLIVFLMLLVGLAGVFIGARGLKLEIFGTGMNPEAASDSSTPCRAEIVSEANQVVLMPDGQISYVRGDGIINVIREGDLQTSLLVGVNNPFIITLNDWSANSRGNYTAVFEGLRVSIAYQSLRLSGDCSAVRSLTVYPKDNPERTCRIEGENLYFPIEQYTNSMFNLGYTPYDELFMLLDAPVDGAYPILDARFEGRIPADTLEVTGLCTSFPLLYVPVFDPNNLALPSRDVAFNIELQELVVQEQAFEHGKMFYLEAMEEVWVACDTDNRWSSWLVVPEQAAADELLDIYENPPAGLFAPEEVFIAPWEFVTMPENEPICDLGWATGSISSYKAPYSHETAEGEVVHSFTNASGNRYSFRIAEGGEFSWDMNTQ